MRRAATAIGLMLAMAPTTPAPAAERCDLSARAVVERFGELFYTRRDAKAAFETWVAPGYIQHNPAAPDGRAAAIAFLDPFFRANPAIRYTVKRIIADGDIVAVHNLFQMDAKDRGAAVVDIFRVEKCRIVEHWDVVQPIPATSANPHPMF